MKSALRNLAKKLVPYQMQPANFYAKMRGSGNIMSGPFKGMNYIDSSVGSCFAPKLYGTYEKELHTIFNSMIARAYDKIIVVGGGEGYYAVGLGKLFPDTPVIVFEMSTEGREAIATLAGMNSVTNILLYEKCTAENLQEFLNPQEKIFLVMDIEGDEMQVLDNKVVSMLSNAEVLVEVHDFVDKSIGNTILERFTRTHAAKVIWQEDRSDSDLPVNVNQIEKILYKKIILAWLCEYRIGRMRWFYFAPL